MEQNVAGFILVTSVVMLISAHVGALYLARYAKRLTLVKGRQISESHRAGTRHCLHALGRVKRMLAVSGLLSLGLLLVLFATGLPYHGVPLLVLVMACAYLSVSVLEKGTGILADRFDALQQEGRS